jgi:hypothetical protein
MRWMPNKATSRYLLERKDGEARLVSRVFRTVLPGNFAHPPEPTAVRFNYT